MEQPFKFEENPYGYKSKNISAPKDFLIGVSGSSAHLLLKKASNYTVVYKNKEVQVSLWPESLSKDVDMEVLKQFEDAWFFQKPQVPKCRGFILALASFDENEFGGLFDSNFLYSVKLESSERYMMHRMPSEENNPVPDDIFTAVGKWIGSVANITMLENTKEAKTQTIQHLCNAITKDYSIPDHKTLLKQHTYLADARWGSLKKFQTHKMDPLTTTDPLGNTIAHLSIHNPFLDVFMHVAKSYPTLLNAQNIFGNTPLHHLALLHLRRHGSVKYFDWKLFWELPWNFSTRNKKGLTGVEKLCEIPLVELIAAFRALVSNERAWNEVKKDHNISKLLSTVAIKYISDRTTKDGDHGVEIVQFFLDRGANEKEDMFNAALQNDQMLKVANLLVDHVRVSFESVTAAFRSKKRPPVDIVLKKFDLHALTKEQLNPLCTYAVDAGWVDLVSLFAKKGCKLELERNAVTKLTVANIIAQCNNPTLPLKYLCVDAVTWSTSKEELEKISATWPEEIKALFHEKDLWRWTLFLEDETRRNRYLQLYSAINRAQRSTEDKRSIQIYTGDVEFSVKCNYSRVYDTRDWTTMVKVGMQIWPGKLTETPPETKYEILRYTKGDPRKSMKPYDVRKEANYETLHQILESIGWPTEDDYIFLMICYSAFPGSEKEKDLDQRISKILAKNFFFPSPVDDLIAPAKWYQDFVQKVYGIDPPKSYDSRRKPRRTHGAEPDEESDSSSGSLSYSAS